MIISLIVAMTSNSVIGIDNKIPWYLPTDLVWFKKNTLHKPVIMGRRTWESINKPLTNRLNIVVSSQKRKIKDVFWVSSIYDGIKIAQNIQAKELMVIGGECIYQQLMPYANRLYITFIDTFIVGNIYFPNYRKDKWRSVFKEYHNADVKHLYSFHFEILERF